MDKKNPKGYDASELRSRVESTLNTRADTLDGTVNLTQAEGAVASGQDEKPICGHG